MSGCIYKITNTQNNKCYIGKTIQEPIKYIENHFIIALRDKEKDKNKIFYRAIRKYKKENFKWKILEYCDSKEELNEAEKEYIKFFQSNNKLYGYNLTKGGDGGDGHKLLEETKLKISIAMKRPKSEEHKKNLSKAKKGKSNGREGTHHKKETIKKISKSLKKTYSLSGTRKHTKETCKKISKVLSGKPSGRKGKKQPPKFFEKVCGENNINYIKVDLDLIIKLRSQNYSIKKISEMLNVSTKLIQRRLKILKK